MANRVSVLVALEGADEGLERAIISAERSLGGFGASARTASDKAGMNAFGDQVAKARTRLLAFLTINLDFDFDFNLLHRRQEYIALDGAAVLFKFTACVSSHGEGLLFHLPLARYQTCQWWICSALG